MGDAYSDHTAELVKQAAERRIMRRLAVAAVLVFVVFLGLAVYLMAYYAGHGVVTR